MLRISLHLKITLQQISIVRIQFLLILETPIGLLPFKWSKINLPLQSHLIHCIIVQPLLHVVPLIIQVNFFGLLLFLLNPLPDYLSELLFSLKESLLLIEVLQVLLSSFFSCHRVLPIVVGLKLVLVAVIIVIFRVDLVCFIVSRLMQENIDEEWNP